MQTKEILERFKKAHPELISFNPEIEIVEIETDENGKSLDPPNIQIQVWHPFIFDNRLIPNMFCGMKVINLIRSNTIPYSMRALENIPLWILEGPHNYVSFVEHNIEEIRIALKSDTLSKYEALDALTGSFTAHLKYWDSLVLLYFK